MAGDSGGAGERVVAVRGRGRRRGSGRQHHCRDGCAGRHAARCDCRRLMAAGVTIFRPETCVIDAGCRGGGRHRDRAVCAVAGQTRIGADSTIRSYTVIENCTLGDDVLVRQSCVLAESTVARWRANRPFRASAAGSEIGEDVARGQLCRNQEGAAGQRRQGQPPDLPWRCGDGREEPTLAPAPSPATTTACTSTARTSARTSLWAATTTLVAPVSVEDGAYIGAGSCITKDVPAGALAVGASPAGHQGGLGRSAAAEGTRKLEK